MAEAAQDPDITPTEFAAKVDTIVSEYSNMMGHLSPTSGAKVAATLATTANGQIVSFSRSFATQQKRELKNSAYADFDVMVNTLSTTIDGYQPGHITEDGKPAATLKEILAGKRLEAENILINGGEDRKIVNSKMVTVFDKAILEAKRGVILNWAQSGDYAEDPSEAYDDLGDNTAGKRIMEVFNSMTQTDQAKLRKDILNIARDKFNLEKLREQDDEDADKLAAKSLMTKLNNLRVQGKPKEFREKLKELNALDPAAAAVFYNDNDFGLGAIDDQVAISQLEVDVDNFNYDREVQKGTKTPLLSRLTKLKEENNVTPETYERIRGNIIDRNKEDLTVALLMAQDEFNYVPRDMMALNPTQESVEARRNYKKAERQIKMAFRKDPEIDLEARMNTIIKGITQAQASAVTFQSLTAQLPTNLNTLAKINAVKNNTNMAVALQKIQPIVKKLSQQFPTQWNATK